VRPLAYTIASVTVDARQRALVAFLVAGLLALWIAACGDDADTGGDGDEAPLIQSSPENEEVELVIGSKTLDKQQLILGEIYARALEAAGYSVEIDSNLGSEPIAKKALARGEVDAYPEDTLTILSSLYELPSQEIPDTAEEAFDLTLENLEGDGLTAFSPTPFASATGVGILTEKAEELGVETISDLESVSQELTLFGTSECPQRADCLVGLEEDYGLEFAEFVPVDPELRYEVLDSGDADLSILSSADGQLSESGDYTLLEDDRELLPVGNVVLIASQAAVDEAGEDFGGTIEGVQENLTLEVVQELNARVSLDREDPADVAEDYLRASGYID